MASEALIIHEKPKLKHARMIMGFTGWMDGGDVSTGTIEYLVEELDAKEVAEIDPEPFYIYNFPGSMEISALFRPHTEIEEGLVTEYTEPTNTFYCCKRQNVILFEGKEPNLNWRHYANCVFEAASQFDVRRICFVGSVASLVPHTRDPRFHGSVSDENLKALLSRHGLDFSNYEGPASLVTHLTRLAGEQGVEMAAIVAEIPVYVQGRNFRCIEAAARKAAAMLEVSVDLEKLHALSREFIKRLDETVKEKPELAEHVRKIEENYDKEMSDTHLSDVKAWFEQQNIRLN